MIFGCNCYFVCIFTHLNIIIWLVNASLNGKRARKLALQNNIVQCDNSITDFFAFLL